MDYRIANDLEKAQAELLSSRLNYLDLAEVVAKTSAQSAEQADSDRFLSKLKYLDLAVRSEEAIKAAYSALGNTEEKHSGQKLNGASFFAKASARPSSPALFTAAKLAALADETQNSTPTPAA